MPSMDSPLHLRQDDGMTEQSDLINLFAPGTDVVDGELVIGGVPATQLAADFGTPAYVIDEGYLRQRARDYRDGLTARWPNSRVYFASKSFPSTPVYRVMAEEGIGVDVAGGGEIVMALAAGFDGADLLLHGNAKTDAELRMVLDAGVGLIVIDNFRDIERIEKLASSPVDVLVRVRPNVGAATHTAMATATDASKFGLRLDDAREAIRQIEASTHLVMKGLHVHVGSQRLQRSARSANSRSTISAAVLVSATPIPIPTSVSMTTSTQSSALRVLHCRRMRGSCSSPVDRSSLAQGAPCMKW